MSERKYRSRKGTNKKCPSFSILLPSIPLPVPPIEEKKWKLANKGAWVKQSTGGQSFKAQSRMIMAQGREKIGKTQYNPLVHL